MQLRIALVGAGCIADVHAAALRCFRDATVTAVVDPSRTRAEALARRWQIPNVLEDQAELGRRIEADVAHVLTPPALHRAVAEPLLRRGVHVLLEKPMAASEADCAALEEAAEQGGARLRVNHNFVHHPAFARLRRDLASGAIGPPRHIDLVYIVPLRQLAARQFGHWMFRSPLNLLLEQAVHPASQLDALIGPPQDVVAVAEPARSVGDGIDLTTSWRIVGRGSGASFTMTIVIGHSQPLWRIRVVGADGVLESDILRNGYWIERPTPWIDAADDLAVGAAGGLCRLSQAAGHAIAYLGGQLGLRGRSDGFFVSMRASIAETHAAFRNGDPDPRPSSGRRLVAFLEQAAQSGKKPPSSLETRTRGRLVMAVDVLLVGGTGFIGRHLTAQLVARGHRVGVVARQGDGLLPIFADPRVSLAHGDAAEEGFLASVTTHAPIVVHLAQLGGAGGDGPSVERAAVAGARVVGSAARTIGAQRLIFVSSIAALYLGDPDSVVDQSTPTDPKPEARAVYARSKIVSEAALRALSMSDGLPLTIVRPGIVVGCGTSPFHSGIGQFNRETHCLGWNAGLNPLPLVLVSDVAAAMVALVEQPTNAGQLYNLVGDVRLTAREYVAELARATRRPLTYHPQSAYPSALVEGVKWSVKCLGRRRADRTTLHDLRSRGLVARFDTRREKSELDWRPAADRAHFLAEAFADVV
jgi:predicted dehydrogenase/nucleoside-diphosphate-sugar epimerase